MSQRGPLPGPTASWRRDRPTIGALGSGRYGFSVLTLRTRHPAAGYRLGAHPGVPADSPDHMGHASQLIPQSSTPDFCLSDTYAERDARHLFTQHDVRRVAHSGHVPRICVPYCSRSRHSYWSGHQGLNTVPGTVPCMVFSLSWESTSYSSPAFRTRFCLESSDSSPGVEQYMQGTKHRYTTMDTRD